MNGSMIGNSCRVYETVFPVRCISKFNKSYRHMTKDPIGVNGKCGKEIFINN